MRRWASPCPSLGLGTVISKTAEQGDCSVVPWYLERVELEGKAGKPLFGRFVLLLSLQISSRHRQVVQLLTSSI